MLQKWIISSGKQSISLNRSKRKYILKGGIELIEVTRVEKATNDLKAEYFIYTNYLFDVTEVTFQLPYRDWLKLEKSEVLKNLDEYLSEVQKPYRKIYRQDQLVVMEKVVYKNPLSAFVQGVRERWKRLSNALYKKDNTHHWFLKKVL